eukprot:1176446-Prorocentrum_minimum.AAC.3
MFIAVTYAHVSSKLQYQCGALRCGHTALNIPLYDKWSASNEILSTGRGELIVRNGRCSCN